MVKIEKSKDKERSIKLTISLDDEPGQAEVQPGPAEKSVFVDEARLFELANLVTVTGERNTEHGLTAVRLVEFQDEEQRQKIIRMLGESFPQVVQQLVPYLRLLGTHPRAAVRKRAAEAVGELMCEVDFIRYKEDILIPWALSDNLFMNSCVGLALVTPAQDNRYSDNVKALLKHWVTTSNHSLNWTAVASCVQLGTLWPEDTFDLLETALQRDQLDLLILATFVVRQLCHTGHTDLVLACLSEWITDPGADPSLRRAAVLIFLEVIRLSHVAGNGRLVDYAVNIYLVGLSDRKLTDSGVIRSAMLDTLKEWAEESFADPEKQAAMETLFTRLHIRAETPRDKERIVFHLQRWRQKDARFAQIVQGLVH